MRAPADPWRERLEELEARVAFQDDLVERLNEIVARQDREILALARRVAALERRLNDLDEAATGAAAGGHEMPPHY